jgi:hypothetical protein
MNKSKEQKLYDEKLVLTDDGFNLVFKDGSVRGLLWSDVDRINVFKEDLITTDLICMEFLSDRLGHSFDINEEVDGFWDVANEVARRFPKAVSRRDWEVEVKRQPFARSPINVYDAAKTS